MNIRKILTQHFMNILKTHMQYEEVLLIYYN